MRRSICTRLLSRLLHNPCPVKWIEIVDDGSTDDTGRIIDEVANQHNWIQALHRTDRGFRSAGGGVMEAFLFGLGRVQSEPWDFLVKLDGDVILSRTILSSVSRVLLPTQSWVLAAG